MLEFLLPMGARYAWFHLFSLQDHKAIQKCSLQAKKKKNNLQSMKTTSKTELSCLSKEGPCKQQIAGEILHPTTTVGKQRQVTKGDRLAQERMKAKSFLHPEAAHRVIFPPSLTLGRKSPKQPPGMAKGGRGEKSCSAGLRPKHSQT